MGWFDEQIRLRKQSDQEVFEDSIIRMASSVLGGRGVGAINDRRVITKAAIDEILNYYRFRPTEIPEDIEDLDEQLEFCLRPHGVMHRSVRLAGKWYADAFGPMLGFLKEDSRPVALLPRPFMGYWFHDPDTGEKKRLDRRTAELFDEDAVCFYLPLPPKKLGVADLIVYMKNCLSASDIILVVALSLISSLVTLILPNITRFITGSVLDQRNMPMLIGTAMFLVSVTISSLLIDTVRSLSMGRLEIKTSLSVEAAVMSRVMNLPPRFFRQYSSGELSSRLDAVSQLCGLLLGNVFSLGLTSLMSLLHITQIFRFAPALVAPSLLLIAATVGIGLISALMQMKIAKRRMELAAKENGMSFALISGVQKIKLAGAEKRAFSRWARAFTASAELSYNPPMFIKVSGVIATAVSLVGTMVIYYLAVKTRVSASEYIAFSSSYGIVTGAFSSLTSVALTVASIKPILEMAEPIMRSEPESAENKAMVTQLSGNIELSNVYFRYTDSMPYVVDGMSLKIKAGEYIAIVGTTGCGKSTLMRLMLGFETPEKGAVYYDGRDMSKLDLPSLRRRIGVVMQDGNLFQGDIYSNIVISAPQLTLAEAWEAAEIAGIADDIRAMPMGMQTVIAEGQGGISGGQKQRLMIARAVAPKPKILMFDEATSALDNRTQKQVSDALDKLKCTRIVIAHRLSTIRNCDRILVLDKGHIMEDGTYEELIAKNGFFSNLVARQRLDMPTETETQEK
ncbi:MAG: NHLP bacteriocin export ABC transporter permease/ATPase subunit [Oscillospiraceae bacterium]|nr:NHLP bacteriocin export ABC transporter permease/ATPase subunit [Oscillospiraceae bacterium]